MALLGAPILLYAVLNLCNLSNHHSWGDDFAQYLLHAENIKHGVDFDHGLESEPLVAPGYPILLALVGQLSAESFIAYKSINIALWILSALAVFYLANFLLKSERLGFLVFISYLFSPWVYSFKHELLTDILLTTIVTSSVLVIPSLPSWLRHKPQLRYLEYGLVFLLTATALLVKPASIALVASVTLYYALQKKYLIALVPPIALLTFIVWQQNTFDRNSFFSYGEYFATNAERPVNPTTSQVQGNEQLALPQILAEIIGDFAWVHLDLARVFVFLKKNHVVSFAVIFWICVYLSIKNFFRMREHLLPFLTLVLWIAMITLWPYRGGPRFILPVAGLSLIYFFWGANRILNLFNTDWRIVRALFILFLAGIVVTTPWTFQPNGATSKEAQELYSWISEEVPPESPVGFRKHRALKYFTGYQTIWVRTPESLERYVHNGGCYFILEKSNRELMGSIEHRLPTYILRENERFALANVCN